MKTSKMAFIDFDEGASQKTWMRERYMDGRITIFDVRDEMLALRSLQPQMERAIRRLQRVPVDQNPRDFFLDCIDAMRGTALLDTFLWVTSGICPYNNQPAISMAG